MQGQECQERTARTASIGLSRQDCRDRTAGTGLPSQDCQDRTVILGLPGQDYWDRLQDRTAGPWNRASGAVHGKDKKAQICTFFLSRLVLSLFSHSFFFALPHEKAWVPSSAFWICSMGWKVKWWGESLHFNFGTKDPITPPVIN